MDDDSQNETSYIDMDNDGYNDIDSDNPFNEDAMDFEWKKITCYHNFGIIMTKMNWK